MDLGYCLWAVKSSMRFFVRIEGSSTELIGPRLPASFHFVAPHNDALFGHPVLPLARLGDRAVEMNMKSSGPGQRRKEEIDLVRVCEQIPKIFSVSRPYPLRFATPLNE